jgi:putative transposase
MICKIPSPSIQIIMRYRRVYIKGGCYFFTVVTEKRRKFFADADNVERLRISRSQALLGNAYPQAPLGVSIQQNNG